MLQEERKKDHYSHFILRLAFSSTEDLRRRFARVESALFKLRFQSDDARERKDFVESLDLNWEPVSEEERRLLASKLRDATPGIKQQEVDEGGWFKVDFENVPRAGRAPTSLPQSRQSLRSCARTDEYGPSRILRATRQRS